MEPADRGNSDLLPGQGTNRTFHLPRLPREYYQGDAVVHWTLPIAMRGTGWLDESFHTHFREIMLHASAREGLFCPTYCLMPDHLHLVWMGLRLDTDQRNGMKFLRAHLGPFLLMTTSCASTNASAMHSRASAITFWRIRLKRSSSHEIRNGLSAVPSFQGMRRCTRYTRSSGRSSGNFTSPPASPMPAISRSRPSNCVASFIRVASDVSRI